MLKKIKKAFTLVELVVVIAVIAILAALSVVSYIGVTNKAKAAADSEIITQLNTQMRAKSIMEGPNKTAYEAYLDAKEIGFNLELMKPSSKGEFVWDQENDLFACVEVEKNSLGKVIAEDKSKSFVNNASKSWVYTSSINEKAEYCQYLNSKDKNENAINAPATIKVKSGFDAGENMTVKSVFYDRKNETTKKEVLIRTNSLDTELVVDAPNDVIYHHGLAGYLNVIECATSSFHVNGYIKAGEIQKGRLINEKGTVEVEGETKEAGIKFLWINASSEKVVIGENEYTKFEDVIVGAANGASLPEFGRGEVDIAPSGTLVVETQVIKGDSSKTTSIKEQDYLWLYKSGVQEQIVVAPSVQNDGKIASDTGELKNGLQMLGQDSSVTAANEKAAGEIANIGKKATESYVDANSNEVKPGDYIDNEGNVVVRKDGTEVSGHTSSEVVLNETLSKETVITGRTKFSGGTGTENDPYLIADGNQWYNMCTLAAGSYGEVYYKPESPESCYSAAFGYFKIIDNIDYSGMPLPKDCEIKGLHIDGNGKTISNIVSNGNVFSSDVSSGYNSTYGYYPIEIENLTFKNCEYVCMLNYYYLGTNIDVNLTNITINNCNFNYGLCETIDTTGNFNLINFNIENCNCPSSDAIFNYIYCGTLNIKDSSIRNSVLGDVVYYTYPYKWVHNGEFANYNATNFDLIDSEFRANGSYLYCAAINSKLNFKDCDCVNVIVGSASSQSMGVGGFYGQAVYANADTTMDFENCTFLGTIISSKYNAAGFTAGNGGKITFTNCEVKSGTIIKNTSNNGAVTAFCGQTATYNGENKFEGTLLCNNKTKANTNNLAEKDNIWKEYKAITNAAELFEIQDDGTIIYKGSENYGKIEVTQTIGGQMYSADSQSVGGGFNWPFEAPKEFTNIVSGEAIGKITIFTNIVNVVDEGNPHNLAYSSTNVDEYITNCDKDSYGGRYLKKGTVAVCKSLTDINGNYFFFAGTKDVDSVDSITVKVEFKLFNAYGQFEDSCSLSYTFTPSVIN